MEHVGGERSSLCAIPLGTNVLPALLDVALRVNFTLANNVWILQAGAQHIGKLPGSCTQTTWIYANRNKNVLILLL